MPSATTLPGYAAERPSHPMHALHLMLAALSLALVVLGAQLTLSGVADFQTRSFLADWEAHRTPPSPQAWAVAHAAATRAATRYPVPHGAYLERLGYVHAWQHHAGPLGSAHAAPSREAALHAYRAAVAARPTWPYGWTALAEIKLHLLQFDAELDHALAQARTLAPWRPDINRRLATLGFTAWPQLDAAQRQATLETARRALPHLSASAARPLLVQATIAGQRRTLCDTLDTSSRRRLDAHCGPL